MGTTPDPELKDALDRWCRAFVTLDTATAADLRDERYSMALPDGRTLTKQEELAILSSAGYRVTAARVEQVQLHPRGHSATATFRYQVEDGSGDAAAGAEYGSTVDFELRDGRWRARRSRVVQRQRGAPPVERKPGRSLAGWLRRLATVSRPSFQELAFIPYLPGEDFALPRTSRDDVPTADAELPVPPRHLWLGYNYPAHGRAHVDRMLAILRASDFELRAGDRVLDFGCGAGRMIRHLQPLAQSCEVWGTDISAEHILWCKRNLSPPFRFATTTKVPHLPFEDRSFRFIYCGSVFTHIDDLADAWLLELRRILTPDGRLYVTIHDNHTIQLLENDPDAWLGWVRERRVFREAKDSFDMIAVGRDNLSQVFYDLDYFCRMAGPAFEVISITPEAYFYQTALLLKRPADRVGG